MNKRIFKKLVATMLVVTLNLANILLLYSNKVYAIDTNLDNQSILTSNANVEFDAYYIDNSNKPTHSIKQDISSNDVQIALYAKVAKGYLKDIKVNMFGENEDNKTNFSISNNTKQIAQIENIDLETNTIKLKQIDKDNKILVKLPIYANKDNIYDISNLNKQNSIKITATYVKDDGKEEVINKTVKTNIEWTAQIKAIVEQEVSKNINLNNQKIMVQSIVRTGLENSNLPIQQTQINVEVPTIGGIKPEKVSVIANQTKATNGKPGIEFEKENWNYNEQNGILKLDIKNETVNNKVIWDKTQKDEYVITYIFPETVLDKITQDEKIVQNVKAKITAYGSTLTQDIIEQEMLINITEVKGEFLSNTITSSIKQLSKGYLYSKLDKEITYNLRNNIQVQDVELVDKILIYNKVDSLLSGQNEDILNSSTYKSTLINKTIFDKILGEEGSIKIYNSKGELITTINKETTVENGNYIYRYEDKINEVIMEISKPTIEGNIIIQSEKAINCNTEYTNEQIKGFENLKTTSIVKAIYKEQEIPYIEKTIQTQLIEPETKIEAEINKKELSTIVKNEGVQLKVILKTNDETCMLYENPIIEVELPNYIENIEINSINLSYDNELNYDPSKLYIGTNDKGNKVIRIPLTGKDTDYNFDNLSKGANLIIDANLTIAKLTPTTYSNINVNVYNNNGIEQNANLQLPITAVAPVGMVTVTQISKFDANNSSTMALNGEEQTIKLDVNAEERITNVKMDIINNYNNVCKNISILGKVPYNVAKLNKAITLEGIDNNNVVIYYTTNENATKDLNIQSNGWTTSTENLSQAKAYLIVINNYEMETGKNISANYNLTIPEKLDYNLESILTYTVYYDNSIEGQIIKDSTTSALTTITTGQGPELEVDIKSNIGEGKDVQEGSEIKYTVSVKNIGKSTVDNVSLKANIPQNSIYVYYIPNEEAGISKKYDQEKKEYLEKIDTIKPNETKSIEFYVEVLPIEDTGKDYDETTKEEIPKEDVILEVTGQASVEGYDKVFSSKSIKNKVIEGLLEVELQVGPEDESFAREEGDILEYMVSIRNVNSKEKENVVVTCNLPRELTFESTDNNGEYNKNTNTITWKFDKIESQNLQIINLKAKVNNLEEDVYENKIINKVVVKTEGKEIQSNEVSIVVKKPLLTATLSTQTPTEIGADDKIQYTINIKNTKNTVAYEVEIEDELPEGLIYEEVKYIRNGKSYGVAIYDQRKLNIPIYSLLGEEEIEVQITAKPDSSIIKENSKEVTNVAKVYYRKDKEVTTNEIKHIILPVGSTNDPSTDGEVIEGTYKISGIAWIDENKNGKRENEEQKLAGIQVKLINAENGQIVKDIKTGKDKTQTTNEEGSYTFSNIKNGKYIVVYEYDTNNYGLTEYRKEGVSASTNSDAISTKVNINGTLQQVAATDTINVSTSNIYNMDIGLVLRSKFNLSLEKTITKVTVIDSKETRTYEYNNTKLAKVDIDPKKVDGTNVIVEYKIKVLNIGDVEGYVKRIVDYMPQSMKFSSELNKDWYTAENGNLYNSSLANTVIKPGEAKELTLILSKNLTKDNMGIVNNKAEIYEAYNNLGLQDEDSTPANKVEGENDMSMADLAISLKTGELPMYIGITVAAMAIFVIGLYFIKKKVLTKD